MRKGQPVEQNKSREQGARRVSKRSFITIIAVIILLTVAYFTLFPFPLDRPLTILGAAAIVVAIVMLIWEGQHHEWTGWGESIRPNPDDREVRPRKTLWDWLQLLIVPLAIAGIGLWFTAQQDERQQEIEGQRAQDTGLQTYLDQMSQLLLEANLRDSDVGSEARILAQARTLTLLESLDVQRKKRVLRFLYEADLIDRSSPTISLEGANLRNTNLNLVNLSGGGFVIPPGYGSDRTIFFGAPGGDYGGDGGDLSGADLSGASLRYGALVGVDLQGANFRNADLTGCGLTPDYTNVSPSVLGQNPKVDLPEGPTSNDVDLSLTPIFTESPRELPEGAVATDLQGAFFNDAILQYTIFWGANLSGVDFISADMESAQLGAATLSNAVFANADLSNADLSYAKVDGASFEDADLTGAILENITGLNGKEIEQQAKSLEGAIMPNGQKYEDWLNDRENSGYDAE